MSDHSAFPRTVALTGINARFTHSALALYSLRSYCADLPYNYSIFEFSIRMSPGEILDELCREKPFLAGISVYIWNAALVRRIIPELRKAVPNVKIVLGGPEASHAAAAWLEAFPEIDCIIRGDGEAAFRNLLENEGRTSGKIIERKNPPFSRMPAAYRNSDFEILRKKYVYYEASRGCPFRCSYCLSSAMESRVEFRSAAQVKEELETVQANAPRVIKFVDRTFNARGSLAREIWEYFINSGKEVKAHFEIHPQMLGEADFELLSRAPHGLFQFEIGVQSTNPCALSAVNRVMDWEVSRRNIGRLVALGIIHIHLDLLAGLPFDGMSSMIDSFNDVYSLHPDHIQLGFLKLLPGTPLDARREEYGIRAESAPPYKVLETRWLNSGEMALLEDVSKLVNVLHNTGRFRESLRMLEQFHSTPFALFSSLAAFWRAQGYGTHEKDGILNTKRITVFALHIPGCRTPQVLQSIQRDWASWRGREALPGAVRSLLS